jgi:hypothetical protein
MPEPARDARSKCARCGHVYTFHRKALGTPCTAVGCHVKDRPGERCGGFLDLQAAPVRPSRAKAG